MDRSDFYLNKDPDKLLGPKIAGKNNIKIHLEFLRMILQTERLADRYIYKYRA